MRTAGLATPSPREVADVTDAIRPVVAWEDWQAAVLEELNVGPGLTAFPAAETGSAAPAGLDSHARPAAPALEGTVQTEPGYMATSLGKDPAVVDGNPSSTTFTSTCPKGAPGLWLGKSSISRTSGS